MLQYVKGILYTAFLLNHAKADMIRQYICFYFFVVFLSWCEFTLGLHYCSEKLSVFPHRCCSVKSTQGCWAVIRPQYAYNAAGRRVKGTVTPD
jgi:hypothetical protein